MRCTGAELPRLAAALLLPALALAGCAGEKTPAARRAAYVGAQRCAPCHQEITDRWKASAHGRHAFIASPESVLGDFEHKNVYVYRGVTSRMTIKDGKYFMQTEGPDGADHLYPIDLVLGCVQNQVYLTRFPDGRYQVLPTYYDMKEQVWFDQTEGVVPSGGKKLTPRDAGFWANRNRTWNSGCSGCHGSQVEKNFDAQSGTYNTSWVDLTINCEACHGPGSLHAEAWTKAGQGGKVDAPEARLVNLKSLTPERQVDVCARCHAAKTTLDRDFLPGDSFLDHYEPAVPSMERQFFSDGRNKGLNYTYISHIQSRCFLKAGMACTQCHDPHGSGLPIDLLVPEARFNDLCTPCHKDKRAGLEEHTHHAPESRGSRCVECHMPWLDILGRRIQARDHSISVPVPASTREIGSPNACNLCHRDRDPDWAAKAVQQWHHDDQARRVNLNAAFKLGFRRDPSAPRALLGLFKDPGDLVPARRAGIPMILAAYKDASLLAPLVPAMLDPKEPPLVRYQVVAALAAVPSPLTDQALLKALLQPGAAMRRLAGVELARRGVRPRDPRLKEQIEAVVREYAELVRTVRADVPEDQANLGDIFLKQGDEERARIQYQQALKLDPDLAEIQIRLGALYANRRQTAEAAACFRAAAELLPDSPVPLFNLGSLYLQDGRPAEAIPILDRSLAIDPDYPESRYQLGIARLESGDPAAAREALQRFLALRPRHALGHYWLGRALEAAGDRAAAAGAYRKALEIDPRLQEARTALEKTGG